MRRTFMSDQNRRALALAAAQRAEAAAALAVGGLGGLMAVAIIIEQFLDAA